MDLNVARVSLIGVDTTMGTVGTPAGLRGLVDADVSDLKVLSGEAFGLGVGLGVLEQAQNELYRLDGPSTCETRSDSPSACEYPLRLLLQPSHVHLDGLLTTWTCSR